MSDVDTLEQILLEVARVRKMLADTPGRYVLGKTLLNEVAEKIDANPKRALKIAQDARDAVEQESKVLHRLNDVRKRRESYPSYERTVEEGDAEGRMEGVLRDGDFEKAMELIKVLEAALVDDIDASVGSDVVLRLDDSDIWFGRGNTLVAKVCNGTKFPMRLLRLEGSSAQAQVIVFDEYRGVIGPGGSRDVRINVIPGMEGDIVVVLEGVVEMTSRTVPLKRHASMHVKTVPIVVTAPQPALTPPIYVPTPSTPSVVSAPADPLTLIESGNVQDWMSLIKMYFESKAAISMEGLAKKQNYQTSGSYRALFQAMLLLDYSGAPKEWENWFDAQGFMGDEMTKRCSDLLFHLRMAPVQFELELDGNVGSSNNNYLISALHIASGTILLDREKRKDIRSWDITGEVGGRSFSITVERSVVKGENGARTRSVFKLISG